MNIALVTPIYLAKITATSHNITLHYDFDMEQNESTVVPEPIPTSPFNISGGSLNFTEPAQNHYFALGLLIIPLLTIFGNLLVILSVIRVRSLHSAINCLILALAVADCMVAIFVMPFAVYIEVNRSVWELGIFLCDVYCATDVTCSTASILTLTVISFDRYRAVTRPIKYSKTAHNFRRVFVFIFAVWLISLLTGSPILALNSTSDRVDNECRFYNGDYLIGSSVVSFGIPLVILLFVYSQVFIAIRQREKWARARKSNLAAPRTIAEKLDQGQEEALVSAWASSGRSPSIHHTGCASSRLTSVPETEMPTMVVNPDIQEKAEPHCDHISEGDDSSSVFEEEPTPKRKRGMSACEELIKRAVVMSATTSILGISESKTGDSSFSKCVVDSISFVDDNEDFELDVDLPSSRQARNAPIASQSTMANIEAQNSLTPGGLSTPGGVNSEVFISPNKESPCLSVTIREPIHDKNLLGIQPIGKDVSETSFLSHRSIITSTATTSSERETNDSLIDDMPKGSCQKTAAKKTRVGTLKKISAQVNLNSVKQSVIEIFERKGQVLVKNGPRSVSTKSGTERRKSMKRKMVKSQKKEKKATKTLGIVVGVFLLCWVPFFTLNIQNAICMKMNKPSCQVGFLPFFLTTWLGYMNSFMNPIIYTTFNADFRRAFRMVLCPWRYRHRLDRHV